MKILFPRHLFTITKKVRPWNIQNHEKSEDHEILVEKYEKCGPWRYSAKIKIVWRFILYWLWFLKCYENNIPVTLISNQEKSEDHEILVGKYEKCGPWRYLAKIKFVRRFILYWFWFLKCYENNIPTTLISNHEKSEDQEIFMLKNN